GKVHVYRRSANGWQSAASLTAAGVGAGGQFGSSLAADGTTLLVGMRNTADSSRGGVKVFTRSAAGAWSAAGDLGGTPAARSGFGTSLALAGDWAFVGAPLTTTGGTVFV